MSELPHDLMHAQNPAETSAEPDARPGRPIRPDASVRPNSARSVKPDGKDTLARFFGVSAVCIGLASVAFNIYTMEGNDSERAQVLAQMDARLLEIENRVDTFTVMDGELKALETVVQDLLRDVNQMKADLVDYRIRSSENADRIDRLTSAVSDVGAWVEQREKQAAAARAASKAKPKSNARPTRNPDVSLLSLRSVGGIYIARLGNKGGDESPLLQEGDSWNGWRFTGADRSQAQLEHGGKTYRVGL